jgi:DNA-binding MarR family transcriptional regulator
MKSKYRIILKADERSRLVELTQAGSANVRSLKRAQMLLKADESPAGEGWTDQRIGEALDVHPSSATRLCTRLEAKGLINRRQASQSRRELLVSLTSEGRTVVDTVTRRRRREIARIVARIPDREQRVVVHALGVFADAAGETPEPSWSFGWEHR